MINFTTINQIHLYTNKIDMRMGIKKIQVLVAMNFSPAQIINSVFIFCAGSKKQIKVYYENEWGTWLLQNKIGQGNFKWPQLTDGDIKIDKRQLDWLFKGLDVIETKPKPKLFQNYY